MKADGNFLVAGHRVKQQIPEGKADGHESNL